MPESRLVRRSKMAVTRPSVLSYSVTGLSPRCEPCWACGSCHTLDSMGSSVKLTNMLISTAATMVMPNSWKNRPTMPPMKPIGRNTATMDSVVASTARPISSVPCSAASCGLLPICTWRTMFSRTTMASSMSSPTHRLSAINVMVLMVKPNTYMNRKVPINAIGKVSPVITVLRQELRNRKTMRMVSDAPSSRVCCTLDRLTRIDRELSRLISVRMPGGVSDLLSASTRCRPSTTATVFSPWLFCTLRSTVRWPLYRARLSCSCGPSTTSATCPSRITLPLPEPAVLAEARRATMMSAKSRGAFSLALTCTTRSCSRERSVPSGISWFSLRSAAAICSVVTPSASIAEGRNWIWICRSTPPTMLTEPTPRTFSMRLSRNWLAQVVRSCALVVAPGAASTATLNTGCAAGSKRRMRGSLTSSRSCGRISATFSRTSSAALRPSISRLNSMTITALPS